MYLTRRFAIAGGITTTVLPLVSCSQWDGPDERQRTLIAQQEALMSSPSDKYITVGFERLSQNPTLKLADLRKSVALLQATTKSQKSDFAQMNSTAILISSNIMAFCSHGTLEDGVYVAIFSPSPGIPCSTEVTVESSNISRKLDLVFATINSPEIVGQYGLRPMDWGRSKEAEDSGLPYVVVGVENGRLHATVGTPQE